jgi:hypothetical protein
MILLGAIVLVCVLLGTFLTFYIGGRQSRALPYTVSINSPIIHTPTFAGTYSFILGSGNVVENGTAYSYVRINASDIKKGDSFTAYPALNLGIRASGVDDNNFTVNVVFLGSEAGSYPYWLNFSVLIPSSGVTANLSQIGFSTFTRKSTELANLGGVWFFSQISDVVNEANEFEYFFYIGNSSTPIPVLTHGPVH